MFTSADSVLSQGLEMTRKILDLVKAGAWEEVAILGKERSQVLNQWVKSTDPAMAQLQIGTLQAIQSLDKEIESLCLKGREQVAAQLRQIHQGRKAGKAYKS